jgi:hypothetical protein
MLRRIVLVVLSMLIALPSTAPQAQEIDTSIQTIYPVGGEEFTVGSTLTVQWVMHNQAEPSGGVVVLFSPNGGRNWIVLVSETIASGDPDYYQDSIGTFTWVIPDSVRLYGTTYLPCSSQECLVQVGAPYDEDFLASESDLFSVVPPVPTAVRPFRGGHNEMSNRAGSGTVQAFALDGRALGVRVVERPAPHGVALPVARGIRAMRIRGSSSERTSLWCQY